jgi:hypothetical protein
MSSQFNTPKNWRAKSGTDLYFQKIGDKKQTPVFASEKPETKISFQFRTPKNRRTETIKLFAILADLKCRKF